MKIVFKLSLLLFLFVNKITYSQSLRSGEMGFFVGGVYYLGEMNKVPFNETNLSASIFFRNNFNPRYSLTSSFVYGKLSGKTEDSYFVDSRIMDFSTSVFELSSVAEFNFIPFLPGKKKKTLFTPYIFSGLSLSYLPTSPAGFVVGIPFGMGFKYNLDRHWVLGGYISMRKMFSDKLDYEYIEPTEHSPSRQFLQYGYLGNKDWYSIFGISLSYIIDYGMKCPAFD